MVEPIPSNLIDSWNKLIDESKSFVIAGDNAKWELVLISGQIDTVYGEGRLKRWAEEIGISYRLARSYKFLVRKGVDRDFINRWCKKSRNDDKGLSFSVIECIARFNRSFNSDAAQHHLEYALEHDSTVAGITGYMYEIEAPMNARDEAERSVKQALRDKQDHEGFSDYMAVALEQLIEENPDAEELVLATRISSDDDFKRLEIKAGVREDDENAKLEFARRNIDKLKRTKRYIKEIENEAKSGIETGHELSEELRDAVKYLRDACNLILISEVPSFDLEAEPFVLRSVAND